MKWKSTLVLGAVALAAVLGCSKEAQLYLGGPPGAEARQALSSSSVVMTIGGSAAIAGRGEDAVGNVTGTAVTFASANSSIATVTAGSGDETWTSTATVNGVGMGLTYITATSGGFTDSIGVAVGPAGLAIVGPDTVLSGTQGEYTTTYVDGAGNDITGTVPLSWSSSNTAQLVVGEPTGVASGRSPGKVAVRVYAPGGANTTKDVVVVTGVYAGTLSATSGPPGGLIVATKAADGPTFDSDVGVKLGSVTAFVDAYSGNTLTFAIPATGATTSQTLGLTNMGPGQVAQNGTFTPTLANMDKYMPANIDNACNTPATIPDFAAVKSPGGAVYIVHDGSTMGTRSCQEDGTSTGYDHWFTFTTNASGLTDVVATWTLSGDNDLLLCDVAGTAACVAGFSGNTLDETITDQQLLPNTQYYLIYLVWAANTGVNNIKIAITKK